MAEYHRPIVEEIGTQIGTLSGLRADSEQQQQQQQQQQAARSVRRFLDLETSLPQEEVVTKLTTEIRTINKLAARSKDSALR
jgi:hypothetical protein